MPTYDELYLGRIFCHYIRIKIIFSWTYIFTVLLKVGYEWVSLDFSYYFVKKVILLCQGTLSISIF